MILKQTAAPASEPVTTDEAKSHVRVDISDDDTLIDSLIASARDTIEKLARRALITQTWRLSLDNWPDGDAIELPRPPLQSVSSITYTESDGTVNTWDTSGYIVDTDSEPGRVVLAYGESWPSVTLYPAAAIKITFVAGYGDEAGDVPEPWKQAIKLLVAHWYENREPIQAGKMEQIPFAVDSLIHMDRNY